MSKLENSIEKKFVESVEKRGGFIRKIKYIGRLGATDRIVFWGKGTIHFVELKREKGGILSEWQKREILILRELGCSVFLISNDKEIDHYLKMVDEDIL